VLGVADAARMGTRIVTAIAVAFFRLLFRVTPKDPRRAIAFAFISVWTLLAALLYVTPRTGSQTSPSGTTANHAHLHAGAAIATGLGFTLLCAACCALMMYLKSRGDD
jgi:energy-coupling factor transporter transmembrane protein EcfT